MKVIFQDESLRLDARFLKITAILLGLAKFQQSGKTSFGKVVCESKAAELDIPSSVPKTSLYMLGIQAVSIKMPTRVVLTRVRGTLIPTQDH
jgi:hypothetical protein